MDPSLIGTDTQTTIALVSGAGPTGLVLAAELARHEVPVRIIDKRAQPEGHSRALLLQPRTLEIFQDMGIVREFLDVGRTVVAFNPYAEGKRIGRVEWKNEDTAYRPLIVEQSETERILTEYLAELGVNVERKTELLGFQQTADAVATEIRFSSGLKDAVVARTLFGCDGAHSLVRKGLGLTFPGERYPEDFILADLRIDWDLNDDEVFVFLKQGRALIALPMPGKDRYRLIATRDRVASSAGDPPEPTMAEFQQLVADRIPVRARLKKPEWLAAFRLHHRITDTVRIGRVFIAGDAAHIHSPVGGQGMNTGIQDAYNLAWKIALVESGKARPALLDTYAAERLPVMSEVVTWTDRAFRLALADDFWARTARRFLAPVFLPRGRVRRRVLGRIGQIAYRYPASSFIRDASALKGRLRGPRAGTRAPDAAVFDIHRGRFLRLFDLYQDTRHVLLFFATGDDHGARFLPLARDFRTKYSEFFELYFLLPGDTEPALVDPEGLFLNDPDGEVYRVYGVAESAFYLIRPDGHIGFRSIPAHREKFEQYLDDVFVLTRAVQGVRDLF